MIDVIAMVYKSVDYLSFICNQGYCTKIVANDPTPQVEAALPNCGVPYIVYKDKSPKDYYLNRVYRCWNYCVSSSNENKICLVNSDMVFSNGWLESLDKAHDEGYLPTSRLVESGKMLSGKYAISRNFGRNPKDISMPLWFQYANSIKENKREFGGLFMPVIFDKNEFISAGMYPEGNIYKDGPGTLNGPVIMSGDDWFFKKLSENTERKHVTCFDSIVYHIQEGEMDASTTQGTSP